MLKHILTVVTCDPLQSLQNGEITYNESMLTNGEYPVDTLASFMCNRGYDLSESGSSICQTSGDWDETPTCNQGNEINI